LAVGATLTNSGTTTINGTFQINQGGFGGGAGTWTYGSASTLIYNHTSGTYGPIDATHTYWPSTSGPVNVTVSNSGAGGINLGVARTVTGVFQTSATITNPGNITANGTLQLNSGYGWAGTGNPIYGASSLLLYNSGGSPGRAAEWTSTGGTIGTTPGYPNNVQISNNTTLNFANGGTSTYKANGTLTVDAGSSLYQNYSGGNAGLAVVSDVTINGNITLGTSSGDLFVGGNLTVGSAANFSSNGRAVTFNGTGTQMITKTGAGTVAFDYFVVDKTAGSVVLSSSPATDVTINATSSNVLQLINTGGLDLNGRTMTFNNSGGAIYVNGARTISSTVAGGSLTFTNYKVVANNAGTGSLALAANVVVNLNTNGNLDFGKSGATYITTLNGTLSINSTTSCFVNTNPPIYGAASLVKYNSGGTYGRGVEWSTTSGAGYPNDVQVSNNTILNYPNTGSGAFSTNLSLVRDLTIDSGSALYMDYGSSLNKSGSLSVGRNISIAGSLSLGDAVGGDLNVAGNWTRTGTFTPNGRAVQFNGSAAQTLTGATTFDYLTLGGNGGVTLQASSAVTVNNTLTFGNGGTTGKLTLGANTLTIGATGGVSGASSSSFIVTNTATSLLKRNAVGNTATLFPVGNLSTSYTPLTITNTGTTNDLSVGSSATIDNAVSDATKIVALQWSVVSGGAGAVGTIAYNWNTGNQAASYVATGTGELGVYTTGPYAITSLGTMAGQTKTVTGVALASGTNKMVLGNSGAVYTPPPANDECTGAITLTVNAAATAGTNTFATKSNPTGLSAFNYTTGTAKDMWYTFTPTCSGSHVITLTPTGFDGAVALFTGGTCPNPTYTSLADSGTSGAVETITFTATAGVTYRVLVWGYNSASGSFTIGVTTAVTPTFTLANTGTPATGNVASNTNNAVLYGFALTPTACTNSFDFTAASITTSGTATTADLSNFRIIVDANANGLADSGEISAPIGTVSTLANPLAFTVTGQTGLTAVTRYLLIADVAAGATGGNTFTASMVAANITATAPVTVTGTATGNTQTITAAAIAIADNTQVTAANIFRGTTNTIISKAQLTVTGTSTTVTAMNFVTAGVTGGYTSADIATGGFKLWVSTTNSFGTATQVGSGVSSAKATATNTETLSFTTSQSLIVGTTYYYWLTVDVAATATVARTITVNGLTAASVVSAGTSITGSTTAAGVQTIIAPTLVIANNTTVPAGNVLVNSTNNIIARAQFTVSNATVGLSAMSYVTASNASGYTSADIATGGFKLWVNTTNTFAGATQVGTGQSSTKVTGASTETITFTATQTLSAGTVYYYWLTADIASAATAGKVIIANGLAAASLTSSTTGVAISGTSSTSGTQTIVVPTLTIANNTQVTTQNLFAGSTNNIVSRALVTPSNDNVSASAISFVTAGNATGYTSADIATGGFKLWVNTTNTFAGATQVGSGQSSTKTTATNTETITFTATQNFTLGTSYYYWLTADIASGATVGDIMIVNGLSNTSITTTTAGAVVTGTTTATGNQTITVPTVTLDNTGTPATGSIAVGASNVVLFGFALTPNSSVDFTAASITTSGTATTSDLSNFRLVYDANANGVADTAEITGAIGTVSTLSGTLVFTGLTGQTAFSAVRRYLLIADASSGATSGRTFTGSLVAANITTTATTNTGSALGNAQTLVYVVGAGEIVINQLNPGYSAASNEYIELVNKTGKAFDLSTLTIVYYSAAGGSNATTVGNLTGTLQPYSFWLLGTASTVNVGATSSLATDGTFGGGMAANNGQISLQRISDGVQIDGVAYGTITTNAVGEGAAAPAGTTAPSVSIKRTIDGNDTNVNSADFSTVANASIYLRNSTGRLASSGATIAAGSYRDLSVTGASSIGGNVSVTSQIRLDNNGVIATGSNVLTLASTGSVSRISGWVNGNLQLPVAVGSPATATFHVGDATNYTPATFSGTVTTAGSITLASVAGTHSQFATYGLNATKYINRNWVVANATTVFSAGSLQFNYVAGDLLGGALSANIKGARYNGSAWSYPTTATASNQFTVSGLTNSDISSAAFMGGECLTPTAGITNNTGTTILTCTTTSISVTATGGVSYSWSGGGTPSTAANSFSAAGTYTVTVTGANGCTSTAQIIITQDIAAATASVISGTTSICPGGSTNLSVAITGGTAPYSVVYSNGVANFTLNGYTTGTAISVSPSSTTTYTLVSVTGANGCIGTGNSGSAVVTVNPVHTIALTSGSATSTVCQNTAIATPIVYTVGGGATGAGVTGLPSGMSGTFSGSTLTLNGTPTVSGTFNYTVTTTGNSCTIATATGTITVNGSVTPTFTAVAPICAGAALSALPTTSNNGITGTWSPALDNTTTTTYTFTPTAGQCATTATLTITVNPNVTPTFTAVSPICAGAALSALPTTSNNGITGTWSPALDNTTTTTYTFTPTAGQCATTATLTITVNPNVTPTFTAVSPICAGGSLSALPTTSNNGITGTWSPALDNTTTTTYTFTPTAGQCATTATLTITVNPNVTPTFTAVSSICAGASLSALPTTSNNGITGTWSPALDNTTTTTYTFTPTVGQCATTATLTITVTPNVTPTFTAVSPICAGAALSALPTTSNNGITGTWSPALDNTTTTTYTFTPDSGQCATTTTLTITVGATVTWNGTAWSNVTGPTSTDAVVFTGNYTVTGADLNACSVTVSNNAVVSVASGYNLNLNGAVTVSSGSLTLNNNANLYQADASAVNTGNIIVKRNTNPLMRLDYTAWSSPVSGQEVYRFSPFTFANRFYVYDSPTNLYSNSIGSTALLNVTGTNSAGVNGVDNNHAQFITGRGYLIRVPYNHPTAPAVWAGSFTGVPNNGTKTFSLDTQTNSTNGYNLVGNPYPSDLSIDQFATDNAANIEPTLYFWRKTNNPNIASYCAWNTATHSYTWNVSANASLTPATTSHPNGIIGVGQGFIVQAKNGASSLVFNNGQRTFDNENRFFRPGGSATATTTTESHRIWLNMTGATDEFSQTMVGYFTDGTLAMDATDSKFLNDGAIAINTKVGTETLVMQGRPVPFDATDVVPLNFKVTNAGTYTIAIDHVDGLFTGGAQTIYIKDNTDGSYHDITTTPFSFTSAAGTFDTRFELVYQNGLLQTDQNSFTANQIDVIHQSNNDVVVRTGTATMATVQIFDIRGRLLVEKKGINASETRVNVGTTNQVLLVQVTTTEGYRAVRKVVN